MATTYHFNQHLFEKLYKEGKTVPEIAQIVSEKLGQKVSPETIKRAYSQLNLDLRKKPKHMATRGRQIHIEFSPTPSEMSTGRTVRGTGRKAEISFSKDKQLGRGVKRTTR
jgi:hypothetical protein